ncbi:MAG: hypothetical protein WBC01_01345 [Solirubrobacterales bacterium]
MEGTPEAKTTGELIADLQGVRADMEERRGPDPLIAEVRKARVLIGWLVMLVVAQFSSGLGVGMYLALKDQADDTGLLAFGCVLFALLLMSILGYLVFRRPDPAE